MTTNSHKNRERLAWTVLISSFAWFVGLAVSLPLGIRYYLHSATDEQVASLGVTNGTVLVTEPGHTLPTAVLSQMDPVSEDSLLETDAASQANLAIAEPDAGSILSTLQVYGNTKIRLVSIRSPRFRLSPNPHRVDLYMTGGRVRASIALDLQRPVVLTVQTPQGTVTLDQPGGVSIEVTNAELTVVVRDGQATVTGKGGESVALSKDQRTVVSTLDGQPAGILAAGRNMIVGGDFQDSTPNVWQTSSRRDRDTEPNGTVVIDTLEGRRVAHFSRPGSGLGWATVGLRQEINRDIRDYRSLKLHVLVQVIYQDLFNCGGFGTECPVMVKIVYRDVNGTDHEWLQGFYSAPNHNDGVPVGCVTCAPPKPETHLPVAPVTWIPYDSPNLIEIFSQAGARPASVTTIEIYASGHAFESLVTEIELLAEE